MGPATSLSNVGRPEESRNGAQWVIGLFGNENWHKWANASAPGPIMVL